MNQPPPRSLMHALGQFVGHIWNGVRTPAPGSPRAARRTAESEETTLPPGPSGERVTLRRTVVEEIEIAPASPAGPENEKAARTVRSSTPPRPPRPS